MPMTVTSTKASSGSRLGPKRDCSIDRCFRPAAVALEQTHPLWASPLRINVCAKHQKALLEEAAAAGVTVTVEQRV